MAILQLKDLHVSVDGKPILKGVDLTLKAGETHAVMGPNGSGKSTLAYAIAGHPKYKVTQGDILLDGESILNWTPDKRANAGLFLAFQYPHEVSGVSLFNFLRAAYNAKFAKNADGTPNKEKTMKTVPFREFVKKQMELLHMDSSFLTRYLNEGFSGGEKKRCEMLQMAVLQPSVALLDETDSGLDIDSLKIVSEGINALRDKSRAFLVITHYQRILDYVKPDKVHVLVNGKIVQSGGFELAKQLEKTGYAEHETKNNSETHSPNFANESTTFIGRK